MQNNIEAVFFDLDGTLVDTAPDLAAALNATLLHYNKPPLAYLDIREWASFGSSKLINIGFTDLEPTDKLFKEAQTYLLDYYVENVAVKSTVFDGMIDLLKSLRTQGIKTGVITNKPLRYTTPLIEQLELKQYLDIVVCADECINAKPNPECMIKACNDTNVSPENTWYVGDANRDIQAAIAAKMPSIAVEYGYIDQDIPIKEWHANYIVQNVNEILEIINTENK